MSQPEVHLVLNRLMEVLTTSLPQYMLYAKPYIGRGSESFYETLEHVAQDQTRMSERVGQAIQDRDELIQPSEFPFEYTGMHDLDVRYMTEKSAQYQQAEISIIEVCIEDLKQTPAAQALAQETLGMAKGHLELLQEQLSPSAK